MTFFRDRYQGVGAIAAAAPSPRSAPAPIISEFAARDYAEVPDLIAPRRERVRGRSQFLRDVHVVRTSGSRPPILLSGIRPGRPPALGASSGKARTTTTSKSRSSGPLSEVEQRTSPLQYNVSVFGGVPTLVAGNGTAPAVTLGGKPGPDLQIGTGIGTPADAPVVPVVTVPPLPPPPQAAQPFPYLLVGGGVLALFLIFGKR